VGSIPRRAHSQRSTWNQSLRDQAARDTNGLHPLPQLKSESVSEFGDREKPGAKEGGGADLALLCPPEPLSLWIPPWAPKQKAIQSSPRFFPVSLFEYHDVKVLNVAGPRVSTEPNVGQFVMALLDEVLGVPD
jgi:hypothetical protein